MIDLHTHSNMSDGSMSPTQLMDYAHEKGLSAIALTDHDTTDGLEIAVEYAKERYPDMEVIPGIELSTQYGTGDVHVVGLYIDPESEAMKKQITNFLQSRENRNLKMCEKLRQEGIDITYEALLKEYPGAVITRAHYARFLLDHGYIGSMKEGFDRYVGDRGKCFVPREKVSPEQAVQLILDAGGIPILAHPILYRLSHTRLEELVAQMTNAGLVGIEAIYSTYSLSDEREIRELATKYGLELSGGSDFHGSNKPGLDLGTGYGKLYVPEDILLNLKKQLKQETTEKSLRKKGIYV